MRTLAVSLVWITRAGAGDLLHGHDETNGLLFRGLQPDAVPFFGGTLCVTRVQAREPSYSGGSSTSLFGAPDCSRSFRNDFESPYMNAFDLTAGQTVYAQSLVS
jgi:hypothetical protein